MRISGKRLALLILSVGALLTSVAQELPPLPSELPVLNPAPAQARRLPPAAPTPERQISLPQFPRASSPRTTNFVAKPYQPTTVGDDVLKWDATEKEYHAKAGEENALFSFSVTNVSKTNVVINWVRPSCGCTLAKLPPTPWTLKPGEGGNIELSIDLKGKYGTLSKYTSVDTSHGQKFLTFRVHIPQQQLAKPGMDTRTRNMQLAMVDRQIVFRGDCAKCHSEPAIGKVKGEELYSAACAICHDGPNRASMVPDLYALKKATAPEYWKAWIINGKPGTLMPAFAKAHGGPLTDEQINTLAEFMFQKFPRADVVKTADSSASTASAGSTANSGVPTSAVPSGLAR